MFGWQAKSATTNGIFQSKIPQINIVQNGRFFYNFVIVRRVKMALA
jgi:hypothetical protein